MRRTTTGRRVISSEDDRGGNVRVVVNPRPELPDEAPRPWYVVGSLLPAFIAAILLGVWASVGAWWLWPVAIMLAVPALIIVWPKPGERNGASWHLRQFRRPE